MSKTRQFKNSTPRSLSRDKKKMNAPKKRVPKKGGRSKNTQKTGIFIRLFKWVFVLSIWGGVFGAAIILYHLYQLPKVEGLLEPVKHPQIYVYDQKGRLFHTIGGNISEVQSEDIPDYLKAAVISIEDKRFYHHFGVDLQGLARAFFVNFKAKRVVQGGSTISQQLAKNLFLTSKRNMSRKLQEAILAIWLEFTYTKDEILTAYLNRAYFGSGAHGVDAAAMTYFGKKSQDITVGESALLAGLLKAPSRYSPLNNKDLSIARGQLVLKAMAENGYLFDPENLSVYQVDETVLAQQKGKQYFGQYYIDYVMEQLEFFIDPDQQEDVHVYTMLNTKAQKIAEESLKKILDEKGSVFKVSQTAFVLNELDGGIVALVGGKDYRISRYNRAMKALRQPGSVIKPLYYLAALERGAASSTILKDEPLDIDGWKPQNFSRRYMGDVTVEQALAYSINTASIRLLQQIGIDYAIQLARQIGVSSPIRRDLTYALGTSEMSLAELTRAYTTIANGGYLVHPYVILAIQNNAGETLYERQGSSHHAAISDEAISGMNHLLLAVTDYGTGRNAKFHPYVAGKSGTTQNHRDAWFIGYTGRYVGGVWFGNDNNSAMAPQMTGGRLPAEIWADIMKKAHQGEDVPNLAIFQKENSEKDKDGREKVTDKIKGFFKGFGF